MSTKRATQDDVAQLAGVTRATVSYVLNGRALDLKITPVVIKRVEEAARKLRYVPNLAARSLAAGKSKQIGLLMPAPDFVRNDYWGPIASGVERAALGAGYDLLLLASRQDVFQTAENYLLQNRVDIILTIGHEARHLLTRLPVPPVLIGARLRDRSLPTAYSSIEDSVEDMVVSLARIGVRKIAWIGPVPGMHPGSEDRFEAVVSSSRKRKISVKPVEITLDRELVNAGGEAAILGCYRQILKQQKLLAGMDAVICWNDLIALAVYQWMRDKGMSPGKDLAVVGFDDHFAETALPSLSTVSFETEKLGEAAVGLAMDILGAPPEARKAPFQQIAVPARFVPRRSTAGDL